jgi:hypothetical protein
MVHKIGIKFAARYLVLLPIAFCLYVLLVSNDANTRLLAIIGLIVLAQIRDVTMVQAMEEMRKGGKMS